MPGLKVYRAKRSFGKTPEPRGKVAKPRTHHFVVQKHSASHLHYDFRIEFNGVLKSWTVPKGPPMQVGEKRLAVMVEDHPLAYRTFHGRIPKGQYGAGTVQIWDSGTYDSYENTKSEDIERAIRRGFKEGKLEITLHGKKLNGHYLLVRLANPKLKNGWLMMLKKDVPAPAPVVAERGKMPSQVKPMLAEVADKPFNRPGWIFETKWDGYRTIAELRKGKVKLYSRNGLSFTDKMPAVANELARLPIDAVLDGEVVVLNKQGTSRFQLLQDYFKTKTGTLVYEVFDLLYFEGHDVRNLPLIERKRLLKRLINGFTHVKYSEHVEENGLAAFKHAVKIGGEGIMAKRGDGGYLTGQRTSDWLKIKILPRQEAVIAGYTEPRGSRKYIGALILGVYAHGELQYIGHTGGLGNEAALKDLKHKLDKLKTGTSPFSEAPKTNAPVHWVKPQLVGEVRFQEWTEDGVMRQPIFLGLRVDKKASLVVREASAPEGLSHSDKIYWPKDRITKGDLARYYQNVSKYLLPYLKDRPLVLQRFPGGIQGEAFYQKDNPHLPKGMRSVSVRSESEDKTLKYIVCNDKKTLNYVVQLGTIVLHPWISKVKQLTRPDFMVIDLDPEAIHFDQVIKTALVVKEVLDEIGAKSYCKTSGSRGLHVCVPLGAKYSYDQSLLFARLVAAEVNARMPKITSLERSPAKRQRKVYLDCYQNREGQTLVAPYSVRAVDGAPVSAPLSWNEVRPGLTIGVFTMDTILGRLKKRGDLWKPVMGRGIDLKACLARLKKLHNRDSDHV